MLGVLLEKQHTVPDSYPLTLNALVSGCNQKTSRDPVIEASEAEVQGAIDRLRSLSMVVESSGGRVSRYAHNAAKVLAIPPQSMALLAVLFLRGPQTAGELRINSERLYRFGDILSVEAFLEELAERRDGALVRELPRAPGSRETRWAHLLSGEPRDRGRAPGSGEDAEASNADRGASPVSLSEMATMQARVDALEREVAELRETVAKLARELGITP